MTTANTTCCDRCGRSLNGSYIIMGGSKICGVCQWEKQPTNQVVQTGWICPKCGNSIAPFIIECPHCKPPYSVTYLHSTPTGEEGGE